MCSQQMGDFHQRFHTTSYQFLVQCGEGDIREVELGIVHAVHPACNSRKLENKEDANNINPIKQSSWQLHYKVNPQRKTSISPSFDKLHDPYEIDAFFRAIIL